MYQTLSALRVDAARVYRVKGITLRRDAVRISLEEGKLGFLTAYQGRVTGAVFTGKGRVIAVPRDVSEKASLARFLGAPLLDQPISRAYLRFTDETATELARQIERAGEEPLQEPSFLDDWNPIVLDLNPWHSLRILADLLAQEEQPYFYAGMAGDRTGAFDVLVDDRRDEQVLIGQSHYREGIRYYDIWASFARANQEPGRSLPFLPVAYSIETSILNDLSLEAKATAELKAVRGGDRMVALELSRLLSLDSVTGADGRSLDFFQNEDIKGADLARHGNDSIFIVLPEAPAAGQAIKLRFSYRGSVISPAGNGVYFVGERGSWYPHVGGGDLFVPFDLTIRCPKKLQLAATGKKLEDREEGEWRVGHWKSEVPIPVAGFNLGEYVIGHLDSGTWKIDLYANRQLEQAVASRFNRPVVIMPPQRGRTIAMPQVIWPDIAPSPASIMTELGQDISDAIRFYEKLNGPFPFETLAVAQIPGSFGQGWPGLLYLSTLSFLTPAQQARAGIGERTQAQFTELVPPHEVAHQWWGNLVGWSSYRDQWIQEGLANYLALLYVNSKAAGDAELNWWLDTYKKELTTKDEKSEMPPDEYGPLSLGYRLRTSKAQSGFTQVVYAKGTWVFHMLRTMLREPGTKSPDAKFTQLLQTLLTQYRYKAMSTDDLQRAVEKVMTKEMDLEGGRSMDWFFDQWVRSVGVPRYSVEFDVKQQGDKFVVRGKLKQRGVPENFIAPVSLYAPRTAPGAKPALLGTVVTVGPETSFTFTTRTSVKKILIDPHMTLLCLTE